MSVVDDIAEYGISRGLTTKDLQIWTFLDEGKTYIRSMKELKTTPLSTLIKTPKGNNALRYAVYRIRCALHGSADPVGIRGIDERILSYFFLRMLVSYSSNPTMFADKVAAHIAHAAYVDYLTRLTDAVFQKNIQKSLGFSHEDHVIPFIEYVPLAVTLKEINPKWKCVNAPVMNGNIILPTKLDDTSRIENVERQGKKKKDDVEFTEKDLAVLFKERIRHRVRKDLIIDATNSDIKMLIQEAIEEAFGDYYESFKTDYGNVVEENFPPCMNHCLAVAREGNNLTHPERFALVTFCHEVGMSDTEIIEIFSKAAHFDLNTTSYQVRHVTGKESCGEYKVPACNTLKTNQICRCGSNPLCNTVKHPLGYYLAKKRKDCPTTEKDDEKSSRRCCVATDRLAHS